MKRKQQAATSRRRSATSAARSDTGGDGIAHGSRNARGSQSGVEITAVERRKKMEKEVESGGVETKGNERSTKKCYYGGHLRVSLI